MTCHWTDRNKSIHMVFCCVLLGVVCRCRAADNWPQFRGPEGDGHATSSSAPLRCDEANNLVWKTALGGRAFSSPLVDGARLWVTTAVEIPASPEEIKKRLEGNPQSRSLHVAKSILLRVICLDCRTGSKLYDVEIFRVEDPEPIQGFNSYASPTPILENGRLYCDFGAFGTACLDATNGTILWERVLPIQHSVGPGSSPAIVDDVLILVRDGCDQQYVVGLEKKTGKTLWKTPRPPIDATEPEFRKAFCTPLLVKAAGREQLIIPGAQWVVAYEPQSGKEIWRASYGSGFSNVPRPVAGHGMVYVCTGFMRPQLWAIRLDGHGDVTDTHVVWKTSRQIPRRSSPILVDDQLYVVSDGGIATCFDALTGKTLWRERLSGDYSASPIFAGGRIYFFSERGDITVLRPGTTFEKLATSKIDGHLMATPAIVGDAMYIRTDTHVYRFE